MLVASFRSSLDEDLVPDLNLAEFMWCAMESSFVILRDRILRDGICSSSFSPAGDTYVS